MFSHSMFSRSMFSRLMFSRWFVTTCCSIAVQYINLQLLYSSTTAVVSTVRSYNYCVGSTSNHCVIQYVNFWVVITVHLHEIREKLLKAVKTRPEATSLLFVVVALPPEAHVPFLPDVPDDLPFVGILLVHVRLELLWPPAVRLPHQANHFSWTFFSHFFGTLLINFSWTWLRYFSWTFLRIADKIF